MVVADVSKPETVADAVQSFVARAGSPDRVVVNADPDRQSQALQAIFN